MTRGTICTELSVVVVILFVAGVTVSGGAFENVVDVALFAFDIDMRAHQFEICQIVIELGGLPGICGMACCAIGSELALMRLILLMAGGTSLWQRL